jgi:hypothetical protein
MRLTKYAQGGVIIPSREWRSRLHAGEIRVPGYRQPTSPAKTYLGRFHIIRGEFGSSVGVTFGKRSGRILYIGTHHP